MKKLSVLLCLMICFTFVGCSKTEQTTESETTEETTTEETEVSDEIDEDVAESIENMDDEELDVISLYNEYVALKDFDPSEEDIERMKEIASELITLMPELEQYYDEETGLLSDEAFEVEE